ncbi:MAG: hypothetical protein HY665_06300 [Chloroflexi bacterium]|nr:hypothetical protein [Chloroflexota bacterium]
MNAKLLRLGLAITLAVSLLVLTGGSALAGERLVDEKAEITLMPKMEGSTATGDAKLLLRIDEEGMLERFRATVDAEGLVADGTYSLAIKHHILATEVADADGRVSFDVTFEDMVAHKDTLVGLKVKIIYGTTLDAPVVLFGKVTEADILD